MTHLRWKRHLALAALLVVAPVITTGGAALAALPGAASHADVQKATEAFKKGTELFKAKKYAPALDHFKQSYALVPSPNSHLYIARCLSFLGNPRSAWLEFDRTADEAAADGAKYAPTHDSAVQERDELGSKLAIVTVRVPASDPATTVRVGMYDVPADRWGKPFPVEPGATEVLVQAPGQPPMKQSLTLSAGDRREITPTPVAAGPVPGPGAGTPEPASHGKITPLQIGAIAGGAVGVVGMLMFAIEGAASKSTYNSLSAACGTVAGCPNPVGGRANADNLISTGKQQQTIANAGVAIGAIGLAAGATLLVLSLRKHPQPSDAGRPSANLVVGPTWAGLRGSF